MMLRHAPHLAWQVLWQGARHPPTSAASGATHTIPVQPRNQRGEFPVRPVVVAAGVLPNDTKTTKAKERILNGKIVC
jgi:hypothetical protein